jgi:hypothetical protein
VKVIFTVSPGGKPLKNLEVVRIFKEQKMVSRSSFTASTRRINDNEGPHC